MSVRARVSSPPRLEDVAANAAVDSADNPMSDSGGVQYLTLRQTMTWEEVVDTLGVNDQELYLKWIRIYFRMGNDNSFKKHGLWFIDTKNVCPINLHSLH